MSTRVKGRSSIKDTPLSGWKEKVVDNDPHFFMIFRVSLFSTLSRTTAHITTTQLREECFSRLEAERGRLLQRAREQNSSTEVRQSLHDIIKTSSAHILDNRHHGAFMNDLSSQCMPDVSDLHTPPIARNDIRARERSTTMPAFWPTTTTPCLESHKSTTVDARMMAYTEKEHITATIDSIVEEGIQHPQNLSQEDYMDLMKSLEESLYADLLREEAEYIEALEQEELESMYEAHFCVENQHPTTVITSQMGLTRHSRENSS